MHSRLRSLLLVSTAECMLRSNHESTYCAGSKRVSGGSTNLINKSEDTVVVCNEALVGVMIDSSVKILVQLHLKKLGLYWEQLAMEAVYQEHFSRWDIHEIRESLPFRLIAILLTSFLFLLRAKRQLWINVVWPVLDEALGPNMRIQHLHWKATFVQLILLVCCKMLSHQLADHFYSLSCEVKLLWKGYYLQHWPQFYNKGSGGST